MERKKLGFLGTLGDHWTILVVVASVGLVAWNTVTVHRLRNALLASRTETQAIAAQFNLLRNMNSFVGGELPFGDALATKMAAAGPLGDRSIVAVFAPTACGRCVKDQLGILREFGKDKGGSGQFTTAAVVALEAERDREWLLELERAELLPSSFVSDAFDAVAKQFPLTLPGGYVDTPLYFEVDRGFRVRAIYKANRFQPEELRTWLKGLLRAEQAS
jgi:hypothetical protein